MITMEAYYAPVFSSNIIASHLLSDFFEVHMISSLRKEKSCLLLRKGSFNIGDVLWETKCLNGIYHIQPSAVQSTDLSASKVRTNSVNDYKQWHDALGHISSDCYQTLSNLVHDVPAFPRSITSDHHCIPSINGKMHKAPVRGSNKGQPEEAEIHYELSGRLKESLNKNTYALHLLDAWTSFSEVHAIPSKDKVSNIALGFINKVNKKFINKGARVRMIRAENVRENIPKELREHCVQNGISIEPSPAYAPERNGTA